MLLYIRCGGSLAHERDRKYQARWLFKGFHLFRTALQRETLLFISKVFRVEGNHRCAFDHEGEYRRRDHNQLELDALRENVTLRPRDVGNLVSRKTTMTEREKKTLHQFVSHRLSMKGMKSPQTMGELVVPEDLNLITAVHLDFGDNTFLIYDSKSDDPSAERIFILHHTVCDNALHSQENSTRMGIPGRVNIFATLYTINTTIDNVSYPIFFSLMPDERSLTFTRAFRVFKQYKLEFGNWFVVILTVSLLQSTLSKRCLIAMFVYASSIRTNLFGKLCCVLVWPARTTHYLI